MRKFINVFMYIIVSFEYVRLFIFYLLYTLLMYDYGKRPDDNIAITESHYRDYFHIFRDVSKYDYIIYLCILLIIGLKLFNIHLISKKQIIIFLLGFVLLFFLMFIDPFGAFNWYLD